MCQISIAPLNASAVSTTGLQHLEHLGRQHHGVTVEGRSDHSPANGAKQQHRQVRSKASTPSSVALPVRR